MVTTDQFETQQCITYTGSYTDNVMVRNVSTETESLLGVRFASKVGGTTSEISAKINIPLSERLELVSGSLRGGGCKVRTVQFLSENEFYYDSFLPSPASIANIDGLTTPWLQFTSSLNQTYSSSLPASTLRNRTGHDERAAHVFFPAEREGREYGAYAATSGEFIELDAFVNFSWINSPFPFQTKYKQLLRTLRPESRYPEDVTVNRTPRPDDFLETTDYMGGPFTTNTIGSFFPVLAKGGTLDPFSVWAGAWELTGATTPTATTEFNNVPVPCWNKLNGIHYCNLPDGSSTPNLYVGVGSESTILTSEDGLVWTAVAISRSFPDIPTDKALSVSGLTDGSFEIYDAEATGVSGDFRRWILCTEDGIVRQSTADKVPQLTGWTWVDLPTALSITAATLYRITNNDDDASFGLGSARVCAVGEQFGTSDSLIVSADQDGATWTKATGVASGLADQWWDVAFAGNGVFRFIAVGANFNNTVGYIARSPSETGVGVWVDITPTTPDGLHTVDVAANGTTCIAAGEGGEIWRTANISAGSPTWAQITPAGSYTGRWHDIKYVHFDAVGTGVWIITGADGETQFSTNDGVNWTRMEIAKPAIAMSEFFNFSFRQGTGPTVMFCGRENFATLPEAPRSVILGNVIQDELDVQGNFSIIVMRVSDAEFDGFSDGTNRAVNNPLNDMQSQVRYIRPKVSDNFKVFFGFGDGMNLDLSNTSGGIQLTDIGKSNQMVDFKAHAFYNLHKNEGNYNFGQIRLFGPKIRGWRYGIYNGIPSRTAVTYRRGRFGQVRDMLEQRRYSRLLIAEGSKTAITDPAVKVSFVAGTTSATIANEYRTATSPISTNPGDSGIYDRDYRSGRPYDDTLGF